MVWGLGCRVRAVEGVEDGGVVRDSRDREDEHARVRRAVRRGEPRGEHLMGNGGTVFIRLRQTVHTGFR